MATAAETISSGYNRIMDNIVDFSPEAVKAPFALRCAAFSIDYILLLVLPVAWLITNRLIGGNTGTVIGPTPWVLGIVLFLINFILLPVLGGRTLGKALLGLTILNLDGSPIGIKGLIKRNILGYLVTALTLGMGFFIAAVNRSGRALQDFVGGTIVVRARKTQV